MVNCIFGCSLDFLISLKLPLKKPRLLQTDSVGKPGSRVAVRPIMEINNGKQPHKKVPMRVKAGQKERPQELIRWTSSMHTNKTLLQKVGLSMNSCHSLSQKCSGSTQTTCQQVHSLISAAKHSPVFLASVRVSKQ